MLLKNWHLIIYLIIVCCAFFFGCPFINLNYFILLFKFVKISQSINQTSAFAYLFMMVHLWIEKIVGRKCYLKIVISLLFSFYNVYYDIQFLQNLLNNFPMTDGIETVLDIKTHTKNFRIWEIEAENCENYRFCNNFLMIKWRFTIGILIW